MTNQTRVIIGSIAVLLLIVVLFFHSPGKPSIVFHTDLTPVNLEVGSQQLTVRGSTTTLHVDPASYNYQATATIDGKPIVLAGTIDTTTRSRQDVYLSYKLYNDPSIRSAICSGLDQTGNCIYDSGTINASFVLDNSWAVVHLQPTGFEKSIAILKMGNGKWQLVDGPATGIDTTDGSYPPAVSEAASQ